MVVSMGFLVRLVQKTSSQHSTELRYSNKNNCTTWKPM